MQMSEAKPLAQQPAYLSVTKSGDGVWSSAGALALRTALQEKSPKSVMDLLQPMDAKGMAQVFREVGFKVESNTISKGRNAVFESVKPALQQALRTPAKRIERVDEQTSAPANLQKKSAKAYRQQAQGPMAIVERVLRSPNVIVSTFGDVPMSHRGALQMVAAQALEKGIVGFGFDGIPGKYMVDAPMADVVELHKEAARNVATLSAKSALHDWSRAQKGAVIHDLVPDSIQRLLQGGLSLDAAQVIAQAIDSGSIANHAQEISEMSISNLLAAQGLDVDAPTIQVQADELGLSFKEVDQERGMYFGMVVAQDHRASLVKVNKNEVIELTHKQSPLGKVRVGEQLRIEYKAGELNVSSRSQERQSIDR